MLARTGASDSGAAPNKRVSSRWAPVIAARLRAEAAAVLGGRAARYTDLPELPLPRQIITETLRLRGPLWNLTRNTTQDTTLAGYRIPRGTTLVYSNYLLHHLDTVFPDAGSFAPDRWAPENPEPSPRAGLFPFGDGARKCIGDKFALVESALALATIASRWQLTDISGDRIRFATSLMLRPRRLKMQVSAAP